MKDFRIAKCVEGNDVYEYAIFSDGSRKKRIHEDSKSGRIKDADDTILSGNGYCILAFLNGPGFHCNDQSWSTIEDVYFIDRSIGEKLRQKFIDGWENTKFAWVISYGTKESFIGCRPLMKNFCQKPLVTEDDPITFDSEQAAIDYVNQLIEKSKSYAQKIANNICVDMLREEKDEIVDKVIDEIEKEFGSACNIVSDFTFDMIDNNYKPKTPDFCLDAYTYKIEQIVIQNPQDNKKDDEASVSNNNDTSDVADLNEVVSHIVNCLESDDKRFSFEIAAGRMILIYDKDKKKSYHISVQPAE